MKKKLSKSEMRVAIAKDVLKQLKLGAYSPRSVYFTTSDDEPIFDREQRWSMDGAQLQQAVKDMAYCEVCAIGAAIVSGIRLYDGVDGERFDPLFGAQSWAGQRFFTENQLDVMEDFFEVTGAFLNEALERKVNKLLRRTRMEVVFKSIAANGGRVLKSDILDRFQKA